MKRIERLHVCQPFRDDVRFAQRRHAWYGQDATAIPECHASSNRRMTEPALITWRRPLANARCRIST
jgi:hypothetical protein